MTARHYAIALMFAFASTSAFAQSGTQQPPPQPPATPDQPVVYEEQVVVTASKVEQQLVNAPATVSVVTADVISSTPATNYAELLRAVPGVNLAQTSARDYNITMRGATSTLVSWMRGPRREGSWGRFRRSVRPNSRHVVRAATWPCWMYVAGPNGKRVTCRVSRTSPWDSSSSGLASSRAIARWWCNARVGRGRPSRRVCFARTA